MTPLSFNLSDLDGNNGFVLNGFFQSFSGFSVSGAGDVNGDGIDDVIIGAPLAPGAPGTGADRAGRSYVVFGRLGGFSPSFNLQELDGSNGFFINGINFRDSSGFPVSDAGDINGDGIDDLIIGANNNQAYVVFGQRGGFSSSLNLADLDGSNGFALNGFSGVGLSRAGDWVSGAGDINGDGIDDLTIGSPASGQSYVVFGRQGGFNPSLNTSELDGSNGFVINEGGGNSVSDAGDINGDGIDDLIIAQAGPNAYVVFGWRDGFSASLELGELNGNNGFGIHGVAPFRSVSGAGDVNGDGIDDLIIGSPIRGGAGQSYVVFGQRGGFSSSLNLADLDGSNGFAINGINSFDFSGYSVSGAGDINGDGIDDLIIGAYGADPNGDSSGQSYVVYGRREGFGSTLNLADLDGSNGFALNGINGGDQSGRSVSGAGDVNGDGIDDLIIGARLAGQRAGQSYVVFGQRGESVVLVDHPIDENDGDLSAGDVSLREAIAIAQENGTIAFSQDLSGSTLNLTLGELRIDRSIAIQGLGADNLTISGNNTSRVFNIDDGDSNTQIEVAIDGVTIAGGNTTGNGGGILNRENLTISNSNIRNNTAANGGGISTTSGTLEIRDSQILSNTSRGVGGGIQQIGDAIVNITNSFVNGNTSTLSGGGLSLGSNTVVNVSRSALTNNRSSVGGGIANLFGGQLNLERAIVVNNQLNLNLIQPGDISGPVASGGFNVIGNGTGLTGITNGVNNDIVGTVTLGDRLYFLTPTATSWQNAQTLAQSYGGNLATINSTSENSLLAILLGNQYPWIGFNDAQTEGQFEWVSGEPVTFTNWATGEPNDFGSLGEDFAALLINGRWNDLPATSQRRGIVEIDLNWQSTPSVTTATAERDILTGSESDDRLRGQAGDDTLDGGSGNDTVAGGLGDDQVAGGEGDDILRGDENDRSSTVANGGNDTLLGGAGNDSLGGKYGDDQLFGGEGVDSLWGDAGDDLLNGGSGDDKLGGGAGADRFVIANIQGTDTVSDFEVGIDFFLLEGLTLEQLELTQRGDNVQIEFIETDQILAVVQNVTAEDLQGSFI
jgi:Ca2+-binding RTX toxin-like protein